MQLGLEGQNQYVTLQMPQPNRGIFMHSGTSDRRTQVIIAHHDTVIEPEDHVIVFVSNKRLLPRVERLFQVGLGFF